jgi:hypothetical protein
MKKRDIHRRLVSLFKAAKEYFLEEEPREKAQRTLKEASLKLNKTVYQRLALEYELEHKNLDGETRAWTETTLEALRQAEQQQSHQLAILREEYRKLAVQDLLYRAMNEPDGDTFQEAHDALIELSATVEAERNIQSLPKLLNMKMHPPSLEVLDTKQRKNNNEPEANREEEASS